MRSGRKAAGSPGGRPSPTPSGLAGSVRGPRHGWASLTPTEQKVVELVMAGHTNPEIAERLLMSRGTVKTHLEHVFAKTGCRNRAEVAVAALQQPRS